jgi:hypothetical protein
VNLIGRTLVSHPVAIEDVNGKEVGLELAREWTRSLAYGSIFGTWSVKIVNELDRCSKDAQDRLLTYLDLSSLTEAFKLGSNPSASSPPKTRLSRHFLQGGGLSLSPPPA